jgi:ABC-type dipeptide/oligopeptide/nickel transport system ATPase component
MHQFHQAQQRGAGGEEIETKTSAPRAPLEEVRGCKFANRCPLVIAECQQAPPPLYLTNGDRAVACYLHKDSAQVSGREMAESLARD